MPWSLYQQIDEMAYENKVKFNRMLVVLAETGIPVFVKIRNRSPPLAKAILDSRRYTYVKRRRGSDRIIDQEVARESEDFKLNDKLSIGLPSSRKDAIRSEARRRGLHMSQIGREKMGLKF